MEETKNSESTLKITNCGNFPRSAPTSPRDLYDVPDGSIVIEIEEEPVEQENDHRGVGYSARLKSCYARMWDSRLVNHQDTDSESLSYFQQLCNNTLPKNKGEAEAKSICRDLYYANKTSFTQCLVRAPHCVLLTEARAIVLHFGIHELVYIDWKDNQYVVSKNDYYLHSKQDRRNRNARNMVPKPRNTPKRISSRVSRNVPRKEVSDKEIIQELNNRIKKLEDAEKKRITRTKKDRELPPAETPVTMDNIFEVLKEKNSLHESWGDMEEGDEENSSD